VKEVSKREGVTGKSGREVIVGKLKSATSKRDIPINDTAIEMIELIRKSVSVDLVAYMGNCAGLDCIGVAMLMGNSRNFYSYYDANVEAANLSIQNYINMFKENAS